ncbi:hypothetical protein [Calothrix sp. UHCC 0171]|uniref:hypothetical protein n=1 Tax=Calothrix sp. UHCC 0171 TaxID=3110245 RepID=UPI002B2116D2|nr:hypothetical protein [Calothrix sp. UHCC 0171]MEA5571885.1 hypothetical protein [Calothrix sp. UHCC 0171]
MTPTLFGRWQTRVLLLATVGVLVSLPFVMTAPDAEKGIYFWVLAYVAIFGIIWDIVYDRIQKYRWDRDWPAVYQLFAGLWEMVFILCGVKLIGLPAIPKELPLDKFLLHYSAVWFAIFTVSQTLMRVIFVRWRFRGGEWL